MRISLTNRSKAFLAVAAIALRVTICTQAAAHSNSEQAGGGFRAELESEVQAREDGISAGSRLAVPVIQSPISSTLVQGEVSKGEQSQQGVSLGLIQRYRPAGGLWVFGLHAFYDAQETRRGFRLQQAALGAEFARPHQILRVDGWLPLSGSEVRELSCGSRVGVAPTRGLEAEYEVELPSPCFGIQPRLALGYYYLQGAHAAVRDSVSGVKARAELQYRWITAGVEWREDERASGGNWIGLLRVSVPLGRPASQPRSASSRMVAPIRRDSWPRTVSWSKKAPAAEPEHDEEEVDNDPDCCGGAPASMTFN
jgi:hypothetical protein